MEYTVQNARAYIQATRADFRRSIPPGTTEAMLYAVVDDLAGAVSALPDDAHHAGFMLASATAGLRAMRRRLKEERSCATS